MMKENSEAMALIDRAKKLTVGERAQVLMMLLGRLSARTEPIPWTISQALDSSLTDVESYR